MVLPDGAIAGYYTLSAASITATALPADVVKKLPRYDQIPAILLGRIAVDLKYRGMGFGRYLLADALKRARANEIAAFAVVVDAKDEEAKRFYLRAGFVPLPDRPMTLFRTMADIAALFR